VFEDYEDPKVRAKTVERLGSGGRTTLLGPGALLETGALARRLGMGRALVVTDRHLVDGEALRTLRQRLEAEGIRTAVTTDVTSPPLESDIQAGVRVCLGTACDGIVTLGGGSVHDVGKAVAVLAAQGGSVHEYAEDALGARRRRVERKLPHIAVSTTAGTGAEISSFAFVTETAGHAHAVLHDPRLVPDATVIDPLTHTTMPGEVTAATGMNALSSAVEAFLSLAHTVQSDEAALEAMRAIRDSLPKAYEDGRDLDARGAMAKAAYQAGVAFDEAGLGIVDSISLVLSSVYSLPHSLANAIVLPYAMAYDAGSEDRMRQIAEALGKKPGRDPAEAAIDAVKRLRERVGITQDLGGLGLDEDIVYLCADRILHHPFMRRNPRVVDRDGLVGILLDALGEQRIEVSKGRIEGRP